MGKLAISRFTVTTYFFLHTIFFSIGVLTDANHETAREVEQVQGDTLDYVSERSSEETHVSNNKNGVITLDHERFLSDISKDLSERRHSGSGSTYILYLLGVYEPSCECTDEFISKLEEASQVLKEHFSVNQPGLNPQLSPPVVCKVNAMGSKRDDLQILLDIDEELPRLKFIMAQNGDIPDKSGEEIIEPKIFSLEYVGKESTAQEIFDTVLHYWYRLIVSEYTELSAIQGMSEYSTKNLVPSKPIFSVTSVEEFLEFIKMHSLFLFNSSHQDFLGTSEREEYHIQQLLGADRNDQEYHAFAQCRIHGNDSDSNNDRSPFQEFEELASLYLYRKDVAFFVIVSESCTWTEIKEDGVAEDNNGFVRILHVNRPDSSGNLMELGAVFDPHERKQLQSSSNDEGLALNMEQFVIVQSTASILWLDRHTTATIAFPIYRKTTFALFIDVHSMDFDYKSNSFLESHRAIEHLREASRRHKQKRPFNDVVFLVIPSNHHQVLKTFGIEFWSENSATPHLPAAMITSRRESSHYMSVYRMTQFSLDEVDSNNTNGKGGPFSEFLDSYFEGRLSPSLKSEAVSEENLTLPSGVQIVTQNNFHEKVLNSDQKHAIVYFYTPTCGHCKRFDTIWHNLARLVMKMNWNQEIDVFKVDVSKNDLHLNIDIVSLPAVYFFHRKKKDLLQEAVLGGSDGLELGGISDPVVILKWVMKMVGEDDLEYLKLLATIDTE